MHLLLSTDFDGTLVSPNEKGPFAPDFLRELESLRQRHPVTWVINTGRNWSLLEQSLIQIPAPIYPDWVVVIEREAYQIADKKTISLSHWNDLCKIRHQKLFHDNEGLLKNIHAACSHFPGIQLVEDEGSPLGIIAANLAQADQIDVIVKKYLLTSDDLSLMRNTIYFRFCHRDYHKGSALSAIAEEIQIPQEHRFVIGDHLNDLQMLDRNVAQFIACPSNSAKSVKAKVKEQDGYIATLPYQAGIAEALQYFFK